MLLNDTGAIWSLTTKLFPILSEESKVLNTKAVVYKSKQTSVLQQNQNYFYVLNYN